MSREEKEEEEDVGKGTNSIHVRGEKGRVWRKREGMRRREKEESG